MDTTVRSLCRRGAQATGFKVVYLLLTLLSFNCLCARHTGITLAAYGVSAIGAAVLLLRLGCFRDFRQTRGLYLLVAFCASYVLSSLATRQYGITENIKALIWMILQYFVLYTYNTHSDGQAERREFGLLAHIFMLYTFVAALVGFGMLMTNYNMLIEIDGTTVIGGFLWGRLWGLYTDPNYGAVGAVIAILMSAYFFKNAKPLLKGLYLLNAVCQLIYIALSDSRTGLVTLAVGLASFTYLSALRGRAVAEKPLWQRGLLCVVLAVSVAVLSVGAAKGTQKAVGALREWRYEQLNPTTPTDPSTEPSQSTVSGADSTTTTTSKPDLSIGRPATDTNDDISNNRFKIWASAWETFLTKPLTGISSRNTTAYIQDVLPDTYLATTSFASMHNGLVDVLLSQGILGLGLIFAFAVLVLIPLFRGFFKHRGEAFRYHTILLCVLLTLLCSMMFLSETFYINTAGAFWFWLILGYLTQSLSRTTEKEAES